MCSGSGDVSKCIAPLNNVSLVAQADNCGSNDNKDEADGVGELVADAGIGIVINADDANSAVMDFP